MKGRNAPTRTAVVELIAVAFLAVLIQIVSHCIESGSNQRGDLALKAVNRQLLSQNHLIQATLFNLVAAIPESKIGSYVVVGEGGTDQEIKRIQMEMLSKKDSLDPGFQRLAKRHSELATQYSKEYARFASELNEQKKTGGIWHYVRNFLYLIQLGLIIWLIYQKWPEDAKKR